MRDIPSPAALRVLAQDVADPADGVDDPRLALRLELAPQGADGDLQPVGVAAQDVVTDPPQGCGGGSRRRPPARGSRGRSRRPSPAPGWSSGSGPGAGAPGTGPAGR